MAYQATRAFELREVPGADASPFANPFYGSAIDLPQRFGDDHFWSLHPGQSFAPPDATGLRDYLPFLDVFLKEGLGTPDPQGNDPDNQLVAAYARWVLPESDFEVYGSWGRDDHAWDFEDFVEEPDHSQAYLLGFQKVAEARDVRVSWRGS